MISGSKIQGPLNCSPLPLPEQGALTLNPKITFDKTWVTANIKLVPYICY